jgi:hypothetical protein
MFNVVSEAGSVRPGFTAWQLSSIAYLALPFLMFFAYQRSVASVLGLGGVVLAAASIRKAGMRRTGLPKRAVALCALLAAASAFLAGDMSWVYGLESYDWAKHNTVLNDLIRYDWPVRYTSDTSLNYYLALYLPAAAVGKASSSYYAAKVALSWWIVLGLFLGYVNVLEFLSIPGNRLAAAFLGMFLFISYSGWDWLTHLLVSGSVPPYPLHLEWGAGEYNAQYSSFVSALRFAPHHLIAALIVVPLALSLPASPLLCLLPVSALWSTLVPIGLLPVFIVRLLAISGKKFSLPAPKDLLSLLLACAPVVAFYAMHRPVDLAPVVTITPNAYLIFLASELGPYVAAALILYPLIKPHRLLFFSAVCVLMVLPSLKWGREGFNDVVMRVSLPLLMSTVLLILRALFRERNRVASGLVVLLLLCGIPTPLHEFGAVAAGQQELKPPGEPIIRWGGWMGAQYVGRVRSINPVLDLMQRPLV